MANFPLSFHSLFALHLATKFYCLLWSIFQIILLISLLSFLNLRPRYLILLFTGSVFSITTITSFQINPPKQYILLAIPIPPCLVRTSCSFLDRVYIPQTSKKLCFCLYITFSLLLHELPNICQIPIIGKFLFCPNMSYQYPQMSNVPFLLVCSFQKTKQK